MARLEYEWQLTVLSNIVQQCPLYCIVLYCPTLSTTQRPFRCTHQVSNFQCYNSNRKQATRTQSWNFDLGLQVCVIKTLKCVCFRVGCNLITGHRCEMRLAVHRVFSVHVVNPMSSLFGLQSFSSQLSLFLSHILYLLSHCPY